MLNANDAFGWSKVALPYDVRLPETFPARRWWMFADTVWGNTGSVLSALLQLQYRVALKTLASKTNKQKKISGCCKEQSCSHRIQPRGLQRTDFKAEVFFWVEAETKLNDCFVAGFSHSGQMVSEDAKKKRKTTTYVCDFLSLIEPHTPLRMSHYDVVQPWSSIVRPTALLTRCAVKKKKQQQLKEKKNGTKAATLCCRQLFFTPWLKRL